MNLTDLETIQLLLKKHEKVAKKFLGQNFLVDENALQRIVKTAKIKDTDHIIEIGPGLGILTNELAKHAKKVTTIELDNSLIPILGETLADHDNIEIVLKDALQFKPPKGPYKVVANIPYNITSPLINHFLQNENPPISMTLLVQKEVAEKIVAKEPNMTVLSLQVYLFGTPTIIDTVKNTSFHPVPKVDSAILHISLEPKTEDHTKSPSNIPLSQKLNILNLAKRAFRGRRKKLSNTLADMIDKLKKLNLQDARPQHLSIEDWKKLL